MPNRTDTGAMRHRGLLISDRCPCCGGPIAGLALAWIVEARLLVGCGRAIELPPREAQLFGALWKARRSAQRLTSEAIFAWIFAEDADGGPENWNVVRVYVWRLRKKLRGSGIAIDFVPGRGYGYRLVAERAP